MKHKPIVNKKARVQDLADTVANTLGIEVTPLTTAEAAQAHGYDLPDNVVKFYLSYTNDEGESTETAIPVARRVLFADWVDDAYMGSLVNLIARAWLRHLQMQLAGALIRGAEKAGVLDGQ